MTGSRNTKIVPIAADDVGGRDGGKTFIITEMSALDGERWATRFLRSLVRSNIELPHGLTAEMGWSALAWVGVKALGGMDWQEARDLLDELLACVKIMRDARNPEATTMPLLPDDVQEISTLLRLRVEAFSLHARPSLPGVLSLWASGIAIKTDLPIT